MDGHHMFYIYEKLIIVIISFENTISSHLEKLTWYQSGIGLDSLTGGPRKMREIA
jgi:hypothetical protein